MKTLTRCLLILIPVVFLTACQPPEPRVFGVRQSVWETLTPAQKQTVIQGYNNRKQIQEQNAPIQNAIDTAGVILNNPTVVH